MTVANGPPPPELPAVPPHVAETLEAVTELHKRADRDVPRHQRSIEAWAALLGSSVTVFVLAGVIVVWMVTNWLMWRTGLGVPLDPPPFYGLQLASSVGAVLMSTMVWAAQNRQRKPVEERARLELQISMLAEQKLTKLIALVEELRRDMPNVRDRVDPLAEAMTHAVDPHAIADALKHSIEDAPSTVPPPSAGLEGQPR